MSNQSVVRAVVALCFTIAVLEGFDIQALGVAAPTLAPEFGLSPSQMGWVFTGGSPGLVLGAAPTRASSSPSVAQGLWWVRWSRA